jgi:predicted membrane-bound spermidine synthase
MVNDLFPLLPELVLGGLVLLVITVDALRPQSGYSGNVYSVEFYELVASRLAPLLAVHRSRRHVKERQWMRNA